MTTPSNELRPYAVTVTMSVRIHAASPKMAVHVLGHGLAAGILRPTRVIRVDGPDGDSLTLHVPADEHTGTDQEGQP